jgi:O-antigen/teichoic acid export membrane protein
MDIIKLIKSKLHLKDLHAKELFKGSTVAFIFKIGGMLVNYLFTYQVTKNYGAQITGLFNLGLVVLIVATVISRLGLDTAMLRLTSELWVKSLKGELKSTYLEMLRLVVPMCLAVNLILFFGADYLAMYVFSKPSLAIYIKVLSFTVLPYSLIMIHSECLRAIKYVNYYLFYEGIAINLFNAILLFVCFFWNKDETILIYTCLISTFIVGIHSTYTWLKKSEILNVPETKGKSMGEILKISLPMLTSNSLMNLTSWVDTIMLGIFRSSIDVGVYNIALKIALITKITLSAVNSITAPKFASYYSLNDMHSFARTAQYSTKLIFWTSAPVMILILIFPGFCLGFFGDEFKIGALALIILTIGQFIASISGSVGYILNLTDNQVLQQNITMFTVVINVLLNIILIPIYGIIGAAIASSTGLILRNLISVYFIKRKFNFLTIYIPFLNTLLKK